MGKHKHISTHHLYLGAGGVVAVVALVVALTFGLSSAQDFSGSGSYTPPSSTYTPPADSGTYMPPPTTGTYTPPPTTGTYTTPPPSCPSGQWWDFATNMCKSSDMGGTGTHTTPPSGGLNCTGGQFPCYSENTCKPTGSSCNDSAMGGGQYPTTGVSMPDCAPGVMPTAAVPCKMPPPPSCPSGQWYDYAKSACTSSTTNTMPHPDMNQHPAAQTTQGDCWNSTSANFASQECTQMRAKVNDTKTTQQQCNPGNHWTPDMGCVRDMTPEETKWSQTKPMPPTDWQQSKPGECPQDMLSCPDKWSPNGTSCRTKKFWEWDQATQKSTERDMTCESWAAQDTKWQTPSTGMGGMGDMGGFGGFGQGSMPFGGQGMQGKGQMQWFDTGMKGPGMGKDQGSMNPCEFNPNDPFCKAGFDFNAMQDQYKFDESQFGEFMPDEGQWDKKRIRNETKSIKMDVKNWMRDAKQIRQQLKEIGRESSGFACPAAIEVSTIAQQYEDAISQVNALNENSSQEEVQKARALGDFIRGKWQDGELINEGLQQKLYGGPMDEDGNRTPGKMESLNVCRELSNVIREANSLVKEVTRESKKAEKSGAPKEILSVFAEVLAELQAIATNPVGVLKEKGVSLEEISGPWQPDPEVCFGSGWGPPGPMPMGGEGGFGGPGPMPSPFSGDMGPTIPQMDFGGFGGFGPMEGFDPEMMEKMKEKFMEMQKGEGNFQGFNPFGASVLSAQAMPVFDDDEFGPPEGGFGFNQEPPEECMPPVQRYLSPHRLMRKLDEARMNMGKQFESTNVCNMLDMAKGFLESGEDEGFGGPPPEVLELVESGVWQEACDSNDTKTLDKIKSRLMRIGPPGGKVGPGAKKASRFGGLIDIDKLVEDKLNEKLGQLFGEEGEENGKTDAQMKDLEARIAELQSKLDDAAKTIFALNERLSDMATKLASAIELNEQASKAVNSIAKFTDEAVMQSVTATIDTLATKAEEVKAVLPAEADKLVDATINSLVMSPPSSSTIDDISERFNALASYASSGAKSAEIIAKAKDELAEVAVLNGSDVGNKVAEGIVASRDTADLSQWYAMPALQAKGYGFIAKELTEIKPAEPETKCAALTRVARVAEKATGEEIDMSDKTLDKPVVGAPDWCLPFLSQLQEQGVSFAMNLKDPNAPIDRGEVAMLIHQVAGDRLPDPASVADYITPDMKSMPIDMQNAIAEIRFNGIMDTTDGTNFSPFVDFNRAQNALVSTKAYEAVVHAEENKE